MIVFIPLGPLRYEHYSYIYHRMQILDSVIFFISFYSLKLHFKAVQKQRFKLPWVMNNFLAHLSRRLRMSYYDHLPSAVRPHLWTTYPLKPLGQFSSNFMTSLLLKGDWKFVHMVAVLKSRWPPCPYIIKTLTNLLLQNQGSFKVESWYIVSWTQGLPSLFKWWP